ncbi:hypothetical protein BS78_02G114800 [Paspalum vaginatum]|nr:hypothetical protein BS78_02G114800 [Paspalum vaginatum]
MPSSPTIGSCAAPSLLTCPEAAGPRLLLRELKLPELTESLGSGSGSVRDGGYCSGELAAAVSLVLELEVCSSPAPDLLGSGSC